jgi:hypothetical protein
MRFICLPWCVLLAALLAGCGTNARPPGDGPADPGPFADRQAPDVPQDEPAGASDAENRAEAATRLKRIGKAMLDHQNAVFKYPAGYVAEGGGLGLSWRVHLLPWLGKEGEDLYKQFKLDEPWDGPTNKQLIAKIPTVYASPGKKTPPGMTHLRSFVGETAFFYGMAPKGGNAPVPPVRGRQITEITDGTSNTLTVAEAVEPVEWTRPDELPCYGYPSPKTPELPKVPRLGGVYAAGFTG